MNAQLANARTHFNALLIRLEQERGTRETCSQMLSCLREALAFTKFRSAEDMCRQFDAFYDMFMHMKPRMAIIQNYLDQLVESHLCHSKGTLESLQSILLKDIDAAERDIAERGKALAKNMAAALPNHSHILIHSNSRSVRDALEAASHTHKKFDVIIAEQEASRTLEIAKDLTRRKIPFVVVPEYMLGCIEMDITCMFIGGVTLKKDMHVIVDPGTKAVVSEMNVANIPVYLLITTNKFSYWDTRIAHQTLKSVRTVADPEKTISFERIKFSHDRLPLQQVTHVVTEEGIFSPASLEQCYKQKLEEYRRLHQAITKRLDHRKL